MTYLLCYGYNEEQKIIIFEGILFNMTSLHSLFLSFQQLIVNK